MKRLTITTIKNTLLSTLASVMLISLPTAVSAVELVQVKGLFGDKAAVLVVDGKQSVYKVGETHHEVTLLDVIDQQAIVEYDGQRRSIALSRQIGGNYKPPTIKTVRIAKQEGGHYWVQGQVNGRPVRFVVDTGATAISMNLSTANRLGISHQNGKPARVSTANGETEARLVNLDKVTIGEITQYQIAAMVMLDDSLPVTLLGNSFLGSVNMRTENGVLILQER